MSVIDDVRSRIDIVQYISQFVPLKRAGRNYKACCPFHSERSPSFMVNPDTQTWRCFGACATGGDVFTFAMRQNGWSFSEALRELGKQAGVQVEKRSPAQQAQSDYLDRLRGLLTALTDAYHRILMTDTSDDARAAYRYAREKRAFSDDTLKRYQIGFAPNGWDNALNYLKGLGYEDKDLLDAGVVSQNEKGRIYDRFRGRLMIPIRDDRGRVVGFGARALAAADNPKYLNSPQTPLFDKSRLLFGLDTAKRAIRDSRTVVIVEGYMDAIQAHQAGFANVVAQMGTAFTEPQLKQLVPTLADKIILALDADAAGQNATRRSLEVARATLEADYTGRLGVDIRILQIPGAKDPDDFIRESPGAWQTLVNDALPVADWLIAVETAHLSRGASLQEREQLARRLLPLLTAAESAPTRSDNVQKLAVRLRIAERDLMTWAAEHFNALKAQQEAPRAPDVPRRDTPPTAPPPPEDVPPVESAAPGEPPPRDYDALEPPPDDDSLGLNPASLLRVLPPPPRVLAAHESRKLQRDAPLEHDMLRMLLREPGAIYQVNRRFRELSGSDPTMRRGPLANLGVEDFTRGTYRAVMQAFIESFEQNQLDPLAYLREYGDVALQETLTFLLRGELDELREVIRTPFLADLTASLRDNRQYGTMDVQKEAVTRALRLRLENLERQVNDFYYLRVGDEAAPPEIYQQFRLVNAARHAIYHALRE